ncbi:hypothetical protein I4U23_025181 [Adineta vaga]|nr:hypothetical protein I4U23_025181 [Adineta vaga]
MDEFCMSQIRSELYIQGFHLVGRELAFSSQNEEEVSKKYAPPEDHQTSWQTSGSFSHYTNDRLKNDVNDSKDLQHKWSEKLKMGISEYYYDRIQYPRSRQLDEHSISTNHYTLFEEYAPPEDHQTSWQTFESFSHRTNDRLKNDVNDLKDLQHKWSEKLKMGISEYYYDRIQYPRSRQLDEHSISTNHYTLFEEYAPPEDHQTSCQTSGSFSHYTNDRLKNDVNDSKDLQHKWTEKLKMNVSNPDQSELPSSKHEKSSQTSTDSTSFKSISSLENIQPNAKTQSSVPNTASFISLGGDSLTMTKIYYQIQLELNIEPGALSMRLFHEHNTIADQVKLLQQAESKQNRFIRWQPLHITKGVTSFAQERIILDEEIRFTNIIAIYNELIALRIVRGSIPVKRLAKALRNILSKHKILTTSFVFNHLDNILNQIVNGHQGNNINKISIADLLQYPTVRGHARLMDQQMNKSQAYADIPSKLSTMLAKTNSTQEQIHFIPHKSISLIVDESARYQPFPVTDIQQAYLVGREGFIVLGHVASFFYQEFDFPSTFDTERLEKALNYLINYHDALRIVFPSPSEQRILEKVPYYTLQKLKLDDILTVEKQLIERRQQLSHQIRPADQWPLFDIQMTRFNVKHDYQIRIHIGFDALIMDFWSMILILQQLSHLYNNLSITLPPQAFSFRDYVLAEEQIKQSDIYKIDKQYWMNRLKTFPLGPKLPLVRLPHEIRIQRHCNSQKILDHSFWDKLRKKILDNNLTPAGFLASIYVIVLSKWSENKHFALNLPIFNRLLIHPQINDIAGDFTAVLPLEINFNEPITFYQFMKTVQKQLWNDLEHISYSGVSFIRDLMQAHQTREIVLPFVFTCGIDIGGVGHNNTRENMFNNRLPIYSVSQTPQVFLDNVVYENNGRLIVNWIYVEGLFSADLINDMHKTFMDLIYELSSSDDMWQQRVSIPLPSNQQKRRLYLNETQWESNVEQQLIHSLFTQQAKQTPDKLAIISSQTNLTYKQLMNRVYSLASHLESEYKIQPNQLIAILMEKGWEQIVACLAILVSGGAYLPLDIDLPYDRLSLLIEETNAHIILTQSHCQHIFSHLTTIAVDTFTYNNQPTTSFPIKQQSPTDLAYVIYTSGSTGKPKGVMISHQAVLNTILDMNSRLEVSPNDNIFALSHLNFDLSVYDIFGILIAGGTIVIPNHEEYKNPKHWYDIMIKYGVTIWNSVPMLMQMLVEHVKHNSSKQHHLRHVLLSGDWIPLTLPKAIQTTFGEQVTITSLGGATEASIWSIAYNIPNLVLQEWKSIPYGVPLRNQRYYVYDTHLDDCPEWVMGELYIGGRGLADGYWNDQVKTQSSFIIHPRTDERLYRTGDYGRFIPDGYIEFMGRKDFQVKVHGHRIELGEIEYHLQQHSDIHQAVVNVVKKSQQLVAYVKPERHSVPSEEYDPSQIEITDRIERTDFKVARHSIQHHYIEEKSYSLTKPKLTDTLINKYYARKSYRQFTNESIDRSTIEHLLKQCYNIDDNTYQPSPSHFDFDTLSELLAALTPINISDQPLPKYRYASVEELYPVQVYVEVHNQINNISSGLYYHNPDKHTLELVTTHLNDERTNICLHFVGRSSAIAPLYGKKLGYEFCVLETGYMIGLLEKEGFRMGLTFSRDNHIEYLRRDALDVQEDDTHYCYTISLNEQHMTNDKHHNYYRCLVYIKSGINRKDEWFSYNADTDCAISHSSGAETKEEAMPLFFDDDNDAKAIFHDCQCAVFLIGNSNSSLQAGKISHLLMDNCLEKNIGICPIGTRTSFPTKINNTLDNIIDSANPDKDSSLLHILLMGKISDEQKYDRTTSKVKTMPKWNETLKIYLSANLPTYMVPSHFMTVSKFPLNSNGKIDRNALPEISMEIIQQEAIYRAPATDLEKTIVNIWQQVLYINGSNSHPLLSVDNDNSSSSYYSDANLSETRTQRFPPISTTSSFFNLGGDSLLLVQIYRHYQSVFSFDIETTSIRPFFERDTVIDHAKLLETIAANNTTLKQWHTLHIEEGIASFAQERIFLDEQVRFSSQIAIYNELAALRLTNSSLSVDRLTKALRSILSKHKILRTSLVFNHDNNTLIQHINDCYLTFKLTPEKIFRSENELHDIIFEITIDPDLFNLPTGRVFYCQILRQHMQSGKSNNKKFIAQGDVVIIGCHHAAADRSTFSIILNDLCKAYNSNAIWLEDQESLQYIDYSVHERLIDMTSSREFWRSHSSDSSQNKFNVPSIAKLILILPEEADEAQRMIFRRVSRITDEVPASYAQARIWLDERIRFDPDKPQLAIYNMPFLYRLSSECTLSISQLRHALQLIVQKHLSLRTSLNFDSENNVLMQRIVDLDNDNKDQLYEFIESTYETEEELSHIMHTEKGNPHIFDLSRGLVFRCHLVYYKRISTNDFLSNKDAIIFNFHHALFDFPSMKIFLHDLNQAYTTGQLPPDNDDTLRYLDYAIIEQQMPMAGASMFWLDALHDCQLDRLLPLPYDRHRLSNEHRTGRGTSVTFEFGQDLSHHFLTFATSLNISLEDLVLATYYTFLFRLTTGEKDFCIGMNTHGRYKNEFKSVIGMFVNAIPLRYQLNPHSSFHQMVTGVFELDEQSLTYAELLHYVQILSACLLNKYDVDVGEIICQCVERSLSMVVGMMAIEMIGAVYCPLSPRDPQQRLHTLLQQTNSHIVLAHHFTKSNFDENTVTIDIDFILIDNDIQKDIDVCRLTDDLYHAYNNNSIWFDEEKSLQYIDYSVHERLIDMTPSREFWRSQLAGYHVEHSLALPVDRRRSLSEQRSGASCVVQTSFDKEISASFLEYASSHQVTPFQLGLATFYAFLFKLTHGDNDICVSALNANRYRPELQNIMGMFVATLPHRIHLDKQLTFHELVRVVHETCLAILEHSYYPLQQILTDRRLNQSPVSFLDIMFEFATGFSGEGRNFSNSLYLENVSLEQTLQMAKFDVMLWFGYNPSLKDEKLSFSLICSSDLFEVSTVRMIARRFNHFLHQIFLTNPIVDQADAHARSLTKYNLILPEEDLEIQKQVFCRQLTVINEGTLI